MKISTIIALCSLFFFVPSQAHIYKIDHWNNGQQDLFCLSDYHEGSAKNNIGANPIQRLEIINQAKKNNAAIIVEDSMICPTQDIINNPSLYDPNHDYSSLLPKNFWNVHEVDPSLDPICGLTAYSYRENIPVYNVEFRQIKGIATDGYIPSTPALIFSFSEKAVQEITNYNDGPALNAYYQEKLKNYYDIEKICKPFFNELRTKKGSTQEALQDASFHAPAADALGISQTLPTLKKKQLIVELYDSQLLDSRIVHAIHQHDQNLIVCAGGGHIQRITPALKLMGYTLVESHGAGFQSSGGEPAALDIKNCMPTATQNVQRIVAVKNQKNNISRPTPIIIGAGIACLFLFSIGVIARRNSEQWGEQ